jgi:hypothetical protein
LAIAPEGITTNLIHDAGVGVSVEPHDTDQLIKVLREIANDAAAFYRRYYDPKEHVIAQFDRIALTRKLASVLDEVCV